jgi:demethoxyubiquinone hydroxylase (CLK1/Coq7/Cat5 family)
MHTPSTHPATKADVDALNSLLRGEISAVETYEQAIGKFKEPQDRNIANVLTRLRDEHTQTVNTLRDRVLAHGGTPSEGAGVWGVFANAVEGAAKLLGPQTALAALKQGELFGKEQYEKAAENADVSAEAKYLLRGDLMTRCRSHITTLEQLIAQLEAKQ